MELKDYLTTLWRRWYIVVLVPAIVLVGVLLQSQHTAVSYTSQARLSVVRAAQQPNDPNVNQYDGYYQYLASEYALDDLVQVVQGNVFASDVAARIKTDGGPDISAGEVQGAIQSTRLNRILTISVTSSSADRAVMIASAAAKTLESKGTQYFKTDPNVPASIQTIQQPLSASQNTSKRVMLYLMQLLVAVFAGVLIALFVDYLDDTLRTPEAVTSALGLPVIGVIPAERRLR